MAVCLESGLLPKPVSRFCASFTGAVDITTSDGVQRRFGDGSVLKVEDVNGRGHKSKAVDSAVRKSIFVILE